MAKHYAKRLKERIEELESIHAEFYDAIYDAQRLIQNRNGLVATPMHAGPRARIEGNEECMAIKDYEKVCKLIEALPLIPG
jgi:hypothetical protein